MMTKAAAFAGSYCDLKFIKSRSVAQITVEIPIERAAEFVAAFGAPNPAEECPVALARINPAKTGEKPASEAPTQDNEHRERRPFKSFGYAQQAGIKCDDLAFGKFLRERIEDKGRTPAEIVRAYCNVESRKEILPKSEAERKWLQLLTHFDLWMSAVDAA